VESRNIKPEPTQLLWGDQFRLQQAVSNKTWRHRRRRKATEEPNLLLIGQSAKVQERTVFQHIPVGTFAPAQHKLRQLKFGHRNLVPGKEEFHNVGFVAVIWTHVADPLNELGRSFMQNVENEGRHSGLRVWRVVKCFEFLEVLGYPDMIAVHTLGEKAIQLLALRTHSVPEARPLHVQIFDLSQRGVRISSKVFGTGVAGHFSKSNQLLPSGVLSRLGYGPWNDFWIPCNKD
jgi:hypothetical protein